MLYPQACLSNSKHTCLLFQFFLIVFLRYFPEREKFAENLQGIGAIAPCFQFLFYLKENKEKKGAPPKDTTKSIYIMTKV